MVDIAAFVVPVVVVCLALLVIKAKIPIGGCAIGGMEETFKKKK